MKKAITALYAKRNELRATLNRKDQEIEEIKEAQGVTSDDSED